MPLRIGAVENLELSPHVIAVRAGASTARPTHKFRRSWVGWASRQSLVDSNCGSTAPAPASHRHRPTPRWSSRERQQGVTSPPPSMRSRRTPCWAGRAMPVRRMRCSERRSWAKASELLVTSDSRCRAVTVTAWHGLHRGRAREGARGEGDAANSARGSPRRGPPTGGMRRSIETALPDANRFNSLLHLSTARLPSRFEGPSRIRSTQDSGPWAVGMVTSGPWDGAESGPTVRAGSSRGRTSEAEEGDNRTNSADPSGRAPNRGSPQVHRVHRCPRVSTLQEGVAGSGPGVQDRHRPVDASLSGTAPQ